MVSQNMARRLIRNYQFGIPIKFAVFYNVPRITDCPSSIFSVSPTPALTIPLLFPLAALTAADAELVINL